MYRKGYMSLGLLHIKHGGTHTHKAPSKFQLLARFTARTLCLPQGFSRAAGSLSCTCFKPCSHAVASLSQELGSHSVVEGKMKIWVSDIPHVSHELLRGRTLIYY